MVAIIGYEFSLIGIRSPVCIYDLPFGDIDQRRHPRGRCRAFSVSP